MKSSLAGRSGRCHQLARELTFLTLWLTLSLSALAKPLESAVGERKPGKEVTSLASAFYQALLEGRSRGEALRAAELQAAKKRPHPYYWAGFSLFGAPD